MRVESLIQRNYEKKASGAAVVRFTGTELIALNNILRSVTKEKHGKSDALEMAKGIYALNALVQHGAMDAIDIRALNEMDARLHENQKEADT